MGGVAACGASLFFAWQTRSFTHYATRTLGLVDDVFEVKKNSPGEGRWCSEILFTTSDGEEIAFISRSAKRNALHKGDRVQLFYLASNPDEVKLRSFTGLWGKSLAFGGAGLILLLGGAGMVSYNHRRTGRAEWLKRSGLKLEAKYQGVGINYDVEVESKHPWRILARRVDPRSGKLLLFKSDDLWYDPTPFIDRKSFTVYTVKGNPSRYYMDISFLPDCMCSMKKEKPPTS